MQMKINKRECRKFADPELKMNQNHGLLHAEEVKYIVRTSVKNIGGKRLLVLYIYLREQAAAGNFKRNCNEVPEKLFSVWG